MKFHSLRTSLVGLALAFVAALVVAGCGGGGASGNPSATPVLSIAPNSGSLYAGVPATFQVMGGLKPYAVTSSEPSLLPVPTSVNSNSFDVLPNNPGVIDAGLKPEDLPVRTVIITVRSGDGQVVSATVKVGINFFTSYGAVFTPSTCPTGAPATAGAQVCSGGDTLVSLKSVIAGNLYGGRTYRFTVVSGSYTLVNPDTGASGQTIDVVTDHGGTARAIVRVAAGIQSQIGIMRITDVATGTTEDQAFFIAGNGAGTTLTALPNAVNFQGQYTTTCGTGQADVFVFDGVTPYFATSSNSRISVTPQSGTNPGRFTISSTDSSLPCPTSTVIITDGAGARTTVGVTTTVGTTVPPAPPGPPLSVTPSTITLACGTTGTVTVIGGGTTSSTGTSTVTYSASAADPGITALVAGHTLTISRVIGTAAQPATVFVTDGATIAQVTVTSPPTCP